MFMMSPGYTPRYTLHTPGLGTGSRSTSLGSVRPPRLCSQAFLSLECHLPAGCLEGTQSSFKAKLGYRLFFCRRSSPHQTELLSLVPLFWLCIHPSQQWNTSLHLIVCKSTFPPPDTTLKRPDHNILFFNQVLSRL